MSYQGPDPRYVQYTKGSSSNSVPRGTVEYTRFGSEYFSGANVGIYFGDVLVDQIFNLQFQLQEQAIPVYGYGSYTYDAVAKGNRIVNGTFTVYFREAGYLHLILNEIEYQLSSGGMKANPFKYDDLPEEVTIETILNQLNSKSVTEFNQLTSSYEKAIWGTSDTGYDQLLKDQPTEPFFTPFKDVNLNSKGFDIVISYGPEARRQKTNLGTLSPKTTVQAINGVHLTGVSMAIDASGQPLFEQYTFLAKDLNGDIDKGTVNNAGGVQAQNDYAILRIGNVGSRVKSLQAGLNIFLSEAAAESPEFQAKLVSNKYLSSGQISTDGTFGPQTEQAVKMFQEYYDLSVDGVVGRQTWTTLYDNQYVSREG